MTGIVSMSPWRCDTCGHKEHSLSAMRKHVETAHPEPQLVPVVVFPKRERSCICRSHDARECFRLRYGSDAGDDAALFDEEECRCGCHHDAGDEGHCSHCTEGADHGFHTGRRG